MVRQLLGEPNAFMDRKVGQPNLRTELLVVFTVGALSAVGNAYVGMNVLEAMNDPQTAQLPVIGHVLTPIVGAVLLWLAYALGLHFVSDRVFDTRTPLRRSLKATAWGLIPLGVGNLLRSGVVYLVFSNVEYRTVLENVEGGGFNSSLQAVLSDGMSDPLYLLAPLVTIAGALATGYLLVYAVQNAKELPREDAVKVVSPLVAVHALYVVWSAVGAVSL